MTEPTNGNKGWINTQTITSAGGVVIALVLIYFVVGLLRDSAQETTATLRDINATLREVVKATQENTAVTAALRDVIKKQ